MTFVSDADARIIYIFIYALCNRIAITSPVNCFSLSVNCLLILLYFGQRTCFEEDVLLVRLFAERRSFATFLTAKDCNRREIPSHRTTTIDDKHSRRNSNAKAGCNKARLRLSGSENVQPLLDRWLTTTTIRLIEYNSLSSHTIVNH